MNYHSLLVALGIWSLFRCQLDKQTREDPALVQVRQAAKEFEVVARHIQGTVTDKVVFLSKDKEKLTQVHENTFRQNSDCVLMIEKQTVPNHVIEMAYCINSKYGFILVKKEKGWLLSELELQEPRNIKYHDIPLREHVLKSLSVSYPREFEHDKNFKVAKTEPVTADKAQYVMVHFQETGQIKTGAIATNWSTKGAMWFDVNRRYSLSKVNSENTYGNDLSKSNVELTYQGAIEGFPNLTSRRVTATRRHENEDTVYSNSVQSFDLNHDKNVHDKEFTLSAFGLPEPKGIVWEQPGKSWLWWGLAGVVLVIIGVLGARIRRSQANSSQANSP